MRSGLRLTGWAYQQLGGVGGALSRRADEALEGLSEADQGRARQLLLCLVHIGWGTGDTRRVVPRPEVLGAAGDGEEAERVLVRLSGGRLPGEPAGRAGVRLVMVPRRRSLRAHQWNRQGDGRGRTGTTPCSPIVSSRWNLPAMLSCGPFPGSRPP